MKKTVKQCIAILSIFLLLAQSVVTPFLVSPVYAVSAWSQTDWSSGVGASTTNQYASGSSIDATTTSGQVVLSRSEKLTNTGFGSDNSSWSVAAVPPSGWVEVPGDATYSTTNFLAMQYEAKYDCTGDNDGDTAVTCSAPADSGAGLDYRDIGSFDTAKVVSTANGAPIVHITQTQAISACPTGHLITNNEWMTVARNAEAQTANWANGTIGSTVASGGGLKRGNVGITDSASYNGADPEQGTGRDTKAKLALSNSSELWDLSGNVWEWNSDTIMGADKPHNNTGAWVEWTVFAPPGASTYGTLSYDLTRPSTSSYDANYGIGRYYQGANTGGPYAFPRGGYWTWCKRRGVCTRFGLCSGESGLQRWLSVRQ